MTREEAIKCLKWFKEYNEEDYCGGDRIQDEHGDWYYRITEQDFEAFELAIQALEQEPRWIPVSEKLPKDLEPVNIIWINHDPEPYYNDIKDKPFTAMGVYFNGQWYWWSALCTDILAEYSHNYDDIIDNAIEVTAWMPLPSSSSIDALIMREVEDRTDN